MKGDKRKSVVDNIVKFIIVVLIAFITYAQYFLVIPNRADINENRKQIYELSLQVEKYQATNLIVFDNIIDRLEGLEKFH